MSVAVAEASARRQNTMRSWWPRAGGVSSLDTTNPASRSRCSVAAAVVVSRPARCATAASAAPRGQRRSTDRIALSQGSRASAGEAAGAVIAVMAVGLATATRVVAAGDSGDGGSDTGYRGSAGVLRRAVSVSWMIVSGLGIRSRLRALCDPLVDDVGEPADGVGTEPDGLREQTCSPQAPDCCSRDVQQGYEVSDPQNLAFGVGGSQAWAASVAGRPHRAVAVAAEAANAPSV